MNETLTVEATINAPIQKVWEMYNRPEHIMQWNNADASWHTPSAENDLRTGGKFTYRMEAKDGSGGFDFTGIYDEVVENNLIRYTMGNAEEVIKQDARKVAVTMAEENGQTKVSVTFDMENQNTPEKQREGWQAILDNFKNYVESN